MPLVGNHCFKPLFLFLMYLLIIMDVINTEDTVSASVYLSLVVSLTMLGAFVVLVVNCMTCCKEREINFKEFEDHFDDEIDFTPPAEDTPSIQSPAEVYTLAVSPVALSQVARNNLSYIQEIGNGWFGQVLLSEIYSDPGGTRVVVKELKANASAKEQNEFLQQGDPYRVLQHPNILQCLGQCVEAIPFLLVFEYCEMGDLRGYLSQQDWLFKNAELLQLQRMACEIAAGVTHLHKHNFLHSDLALRNCYLTSDLTVKVGDYGIGPQRYKEDYIITEDEVFAPLRWLSPELVSERHGGVITMEQTKPSNVWALGVTLWELFETAAQPYPHLSDREVLYHVIKEQQVKLFKPQLELPYSDRWYEVLQFCWLSPDKRATAEEVHRLLTYLRMQGQKDMEEDFEQRWDALKPNPTTRQTTVSHSSFPILDQFADDALRQENDEVLTVTETSKGLSFEYVWEAAKHDHYEGSHGRSGMDMTLNYHSMFFPVSSEDIRARFPDPISQAVEAGSGSPLSGVHGIVPVFDAQKPSNGNEYFIQLEEQGESTVKKTEEDVGFNSSQQDFVVLQDVHLDESSTDADFFHQSIDSKDSYLPDSHIWSSLENDSPYHTNIFTEEESRHEDSSTWRHGFMELPERNGNPFLEASPQQLDEINANKDYAEHFLVETSPPAVPVEVKGENFDSRRLQSTERLTENFLFLKDHSLIKDGFSLTSSHQSFLSPGLVHEPENTFKMKTWDNLQNLSSLNTEDSYFKPALHHSLLESQTLVPSITVNAEDAASSPVSVRNGFTEEFSLLHPLDLGFDSVSEKLEVPVSVAAKPATPPSDSAITDSLCTDAKIPSLHDELSEGVNIEYKLPENPLEDTLSSFDGHNDDLTSNDLLSELNEDVDIELETTLSDPEESFMDTNGGPLIRSSLLVSGPSLDQISQDSLLEDSTYTTLPTVDNSAETPDSLDSLDIQRLGERDLMNDQTTQDKLLPPYKISDSGYETENLESPEWNSQPNTDCSPVRNGTNICKEEAIEELSAAANVVVAPEIVISEAEGVLDVGTEEPAMSSNYRDSAYFSDNESEPEKKNEETTAGGSVEDSWPRNSLDSVKDPVKEVSEELAGDSLVPLEGLSVLAQTLTVAEEVPDVKVSELISEEAESDITENLTQTNSRDEADPFTDSTVPRAFHSSDGPDISTLPIAAYSKQEPETAVHAKLTRTYHSDGHKIKEPDVEGRYLGRRDCSMLDGQEEGMDADEEDEISDESDDDVHAYNLRSSSSESEDEVEHPVPLIISDDSSAKNLKSLLKPAAINVEASTSPSAGNSRRAVTFFDDVTVYLFDQETPTKELGEYSSSGADGQAPEPSSPAPSPGFLSRFANSESSTDEEGGGFEWDDDFSSPAPSFLPKEGKGSVMKTMASSSTASGFSPPAAGRVLEHSWTNASNYSRFSISPASIASFSLTHVTDSDIEQGGKLNSTI
uniref:Serine/threonine-protein kinase LMTK2 n=1 Tax=Gouania willdenowi TaxID=441366 RepID=A0A8C5E0B0_GOUWI